MTAPSGSDYFAASQDPRNLDPAIRSARFFKDGLGLPLVASGANAVVFKADVNGAVEALRFFTNIVASTQERYDALGSHLAARGPKAAAQATWLADAISIRDTPWPALRMEWVEGLTLDRYVDALVAGNDSAALSVLAIEWRNLAATMVAADFAHGDLQHGNVLVDTAGQIRLVDLDGVWIPAVATKEPPAEIGHPNYQHPVRRRATSWNQWMDAFSELVIYLSIKALAADPQLWGAFHDSEQLIFNEADFRTPGVNPIWGRLASLNPDIRGLAAILEECCDPGGPDQVTLEQLLAGRSDSMVTLMPAEPSPPEKPIDRVIPAEPEPPHRRRPIPQPPSDTSTKPPPSRRRPLVAALVAVVLVGVGVIVGRTAFSSCSGPSCQAAGATTSSQPPPTDPPTTPPPPTTTPPTTVSVADQETRILMTSAPSGTNCQPAKVVAGSGYEAAIACTIRSAPSGFAPYAAQAGQIGLHLLLAPDATAVDALFTKILTAANLPAGPCLLDPGHGHWSAFFSRGSYGCNLDVNPAYKTDFYWTTGRILYFVTLSNTDYGAARQLFMSWACSFDCTMTPG